MPNASTSNEKAAASKDVRDTNRDYQQAVKDHGHGSRQVREASARVTAAEKYAHEAL